MLNMSHIQSKYGISKKLHDSFDLMEILTIGDMLSFTPDIDISECTYRDSTGNYVIFADQSICSVSLPYQNMFIRSKDIAI